MVLLGLIELPREWTSTGDANEMIPFLPFDPVDGVENKGPTTCLPSWKLVCQIFTDLTSQQTFGEQGIVQSINISYVHR